MAKLANNQATTWPWQNAQRGWEEKWRRGQVVSWQGNAFALAYLWDTCYMCCIMPAQTQLRSWQRALGRVPGGGVGCQGVYSKSSNKYKPHKATRLPNPSKRQTACLPAWFGCLAALSSHPKVLFIHPNSTHTHTHTQKTPCHSPRCHFGQLLNMISMKLPQSKQSEAGRKRSRVTGASVESNGMQYSKYMYLQPRQGEQQQQQQLQQQQQQLQQQHQSQ